MKRYRSAQPMCGNHTEVKVLNGYSRKGAFQGKISKRAKWLVLWVFIIDVYLIFKTSKEKCQRKQFAWIQGVIIDPRSLRFQC